ncbi:MAG: hypothetical protein AB7O66_07845 [Limisphaerales bacterium]
MIRTVWPAGLIIASALLVGCRLMQGIADAPGNTVRTLAPGKQEKALDPVVLQHALMRFADDFAGRIRVALRPLRPVGDIGEADIQSWRVGLQMNAWSTAAGPNAVASLFDLAAMVTVLRINTEEHWIPAVFGEQARPLLDSVRAAEAEIWTIASQFLAPEQTESLREEVESWRRQNPDPGSVSYARQVHFSMNFASKLAKTPKEGSSLLGALMLDPFAGLDPAARELAQTRLFGERALYIGQRLPSLLQAQTELMVRRTVAVPEIRRALEDASRVTADLDRFVTAAEGLPEMVRTERVALLKAVEDQEARLRPVLAEVRESLLAGSRFSESFTATLAGFDAVMVRMRELGWTGDTSPDPPSDTKAEPFRIQDYTEAAAQLEASARQLTELLDRMGGTLGSTNFFPVVEEARLGGKAVVDHAFHRLIQCIGIVLAASLIYRFVVARWAPPVIAVTGSESTTRPGHVPRV